MKILLICCVSAIVFVLIFRSIERRLIFYPMKEITLTPGETGLPFEEVEFTAEDAVRISGWIIPRPEAEFTVLFCHGNAGNISHRLDKLRILYDLGLQVLIFDYRGYGKSAGRPYERGIHRDTAAAYRYLIDDRKITPSSIILYGESIGGGFAVHLASNEEIGGLITEDTFTSIPDMARRAFGFPVRYILSTRLDSLSRIHLIKSPKLIIHAQEDEIVPFEDGLALYEQAREPKVFLKLRGSHNGAFLESAEEYREGIRSFIGTLS